MKRIIKGFLLLCLSICLCLPSLPAAAAEASMETDLRFAAEQVQKMTPSPTLAMTGGDWAVLGLARSGQAISDSYFQSYYQEVSRIVKAQEGILHQRKYTEYSRVVLALTAAGFDPRQVAGYDLTKPLLDTDQVIWQGVSGPAFALLALDSAAYYSDVEGAAARDAYVGYLLSQQLPDGGFSLNGKSPADPDVTAVVLQALSNYQSREKVPAAIEKALDCLSHLQQADGGYISQGEANSESVAQVMLALSQLDISLSDSRFVKNGKSLTDALAAYKLSDGYKHLPGDSQADAMATEQALYALAAAVRQEKGLNHLYDMEDVPPRSIQSGQSSGKQHADVSLPAVSHPNRDFSDIRSHASREAILALASRGIIDGMGSSGRFAPDQGMSRAQYAAIVVRALGLPQKAASFTDVSAGSWYNGYVGAASAYGIVQGVGQNAFNPEGSITREEAAIMTARAAALCGMNNALGSAEIRNQLASFSDYTKSHDWARASLAFCYQQEILNPADLSIRPLEPVLRCEVADMLYNMLHASGLLAK
ncbi:MAG: S-layer homology domain-containing protein [Firmicutes bacterium]|nr:S-layer homology domain-containing protein [Bacillota bacterium]